MQPAASQQRKECCCRADSWAGACEGACEGNVWSGRGGWRVRTMATASRGMTRVTAVMTAWSCVNAAGMAPCSRSPRQFSAMNAGGPALLSQFQRNFTGYSGASHKTSVSDCC